MFDYNSGCFFLTNFGDFLLTRNGYNRLTLTESTIYETLKVEIYDDTYRKYHFNRAIRMFSYFKKTCKKTEKENTYELTVDYDKSDESEIIIKILMFGPNMKVLGPMDVSCEVNQRIKKQKELGI